MYSPATVKVAVVAALPSAVSTAGFGGSNLTAPGPRCTVHVSASGGGGVNPPRPRAPRAAAPAGASIASAASAAAPRPRPRPRPAVGSGMLIFGPSSVAHTVNGSGSGSVVLY